MDLLSSRTHIITGILIGLFAIHMKTRFDDMRDPWRAELRRLEGVFDARVRHREEWR
jgi:hypothetical protein